MSIKMYVNGTPGGTDGTEITSLTVKNLMKYTKGAYGYYNVGTATTFFPIFLREEAGITATSVKIANKNTSDLHTGSKNCGTSWPTGNCDLNCYTGITEMGTVGQTNVMALLGVSVDADIPSGKELFTISCVEN